MLRTGMALAALAVWAFALPAQARGQVKYEAPAGAWDIAQDPSGLITFTAQGKRAHAKIELHPPEIAPVDPAQLARDLAQSPPPELVDRSEVQTFTSPDGRAVVALDGKSSSKPRSSTRQCWVFDHGQRVLAQYTAGDAAEFKRHEQVFMTFVASIRLEADPAAPQPSAPAPAATSPVDATVAFSIPPGWKRNNVANVVWLSAPVGADRAASYILVTPAERLMGDFAAWYEHKLSAGLSIQARGPMQRQPVSTGYEIIRQRLTLMRGQERREQDVLAAHRGNAAVLVALDAPTQAALDAREPEYRAFLAALDIKPELSGVAPAQAQPASAPAGFPELGLPAGWTLSGQTPAWRTYSAPGSSPQGYAAILVSQVTAGADPARILADTRRGLGLPGAGAPTSSSYPDGRKLERITDPLSGAIPATQTAVLSRGDRVVIVILRANRSDLFAAQQPVFDQALAGLRL